MKRALVTGASRGIGRMVAEMLLAEGWEVWGLSRTDPKIDAAAFWWIEYDLAEPHDPWTMGFVSGTDPLDALVHCAGIRGPYGPFEAVDLDAWCDTIQTNLIGTACVVRAALPLLRRSDDPRVLLFSGGGAFSPEPGYSAYAASKGATVSLMETLAAELVPDVAVNCIAPGFIATDIHKGTPHEGKPAAPDALGNVGACVLHLLSPATRGLTGRTISAQHDDWASIDQTSVDALNASSMGTRDRHKIQCVRSLVRPKRLAAV